LVYLPFILLSISLFDAATPLNSRILSPMIVPVFVTALALILRHMTCSRIKVVTCVLTALIALETGYKLYHTAIWSRRIHHTGLEYSSREWHDSAILRYVATLPPDELIYTNATDVLYLLANRTGCTVPQTSLRKKNVSEVRLGRFFRSLRPMQKDLLLHDGLLIYFDGVQRQDFLAGYDAINPWVPLELVKEIHDPKSEVGSGRVYRVAPGVPSKLPSGGDRDEK
jgi:hypothetical protein